jgi:hypothetical protein
MDVSKVVAEGHPEARFTVRPAAWTPRRRPEGLTVFAVFAVFTGNYQREITPSPQKSSVSEGPADDKTAG